MDLENKENQESGLSLMDIISIIKLNWIMITFFTLLLGVLTFAYVSRFVEDRYKSTSEILVQVPLTGGQVDTNTLMNSQRLLDTASEFARSPHIVEKLRTTEYRSLITNTSHLAILDELTNRAIIESISVNSSNTSFIIKFSYSHSDADFTQVMTSVLTTILIENEVTMFKDTFIELSPASDPVDDSPNRILYIIVGLMGGAIIGIGLAFIKHLFNNSYMTKEQLEQGTGIQVIGVIPEFTIKEGKKK
ncbi:YveK family protein [Acholeplasma laidlawii]|uniref:YveK family protein n=1 Tax=Acholeplasma laidlawii TaxID=2148 RepID=UPI0021F6FD5B|nr:Wzz/FepE/Etk N-terminal domain-containing protein [Acholeplasma laidlawii]